MLHFARDAPTAKYFVEELGMDVNDVDKYGKTFMHSLIGNGQRSTDISSEIEILKYLIHEVGLTVPAECIDWLFYKVVVAGDLEYLKKLFASYGDEIDVNTGIGADKFHEKTLLELAVGQADLSIMQYLVEKGADVNKWCNTPPILLACHSHFRTGLEAVQYLLDKGADLRLMCHGKPILRRVLFSLDEHECTELLKKIMVDYDVGGDDAREDYASERYLLHQASRTSNIGMAAFLIEDRKATIDCRDYKGQTPLHLATDSTMAEYLLKQGADPSLLDNEFNNIVMIWARGTPTENSWNAIYWIIRKRGVDIEFMNKSGQTLLDVVEDYDPETDPDYDIEDLQPDMAEYIRLLQGALSSSRQGVEALRTYIETNPDVDRAARDEKGNTWFLQACARGDLDVARFWLLEDQPRQDAVGVLRAKNNQGQTAVHLAAESGNVDLLKFLAEQGDSLWMQETDKSGGTALHSACCTGKVKAVQWLVGNHGLDILRRDSVGNSAFDKAVDAGHLGVMVWYNVSPLGTQRLKRRRE